MFIELLLLLLCYGLFLFWRRHRNLQRWDHFPGPKGIKSLPFIGHAYLLGDDPIRALLGLRDKYGNIFRLDLGSVPCVVIAGYEEGLEAYKQEVF